MRHYYYGYGEPLAVVMMMFLVGIFVIFFGLRMDNQWVGLDLGMSQAEAQMHTDVAQIEADKERAVNRIWAIATTIVGVALIAGGVAIYFIRKAAQVREKQIDAMQALADHTNPPDHLLVDNLRRSAHENGYGFQVVDGYAELLDDRGNVLKRKQLPVAPAKQIEMRS